MLNFASKTERKISKDFERKGYIIQNVLDIKSLENIKKILVNSINKNVKVDLPIHGDLNKVLSQVLPHLENEDHSLWFNQINDTLSHSTITQTS